MMAPYQCLEQLAAQGIHAVPSLDFFRLRWFLTSDNPHDCISILQDSGNALSSQEMYSIDHPINQQPATYPPVSSMTISIDMLDQYESDWIDAHQPGACTSSQLAISDEYRILAPFMRTHWML
jgi:hypothetical protein